VIGGAKANWLFTTAATALIWRGGQRQGRLGNITSFGSSIVHRVLT